MFRRMFVLVTVLMCTVPVLSWAQIQQTYTLVPLPDGLAAALDPSGPPLAVGTVRLATPGMPTVAAILTPAGPVPLALLAGGTFSQAAGICGPYIVGYSGTGNFSLLTHAFLTVEGEPGVRDLGTTGDDGLFSAAASVNCAGQVPGRADNPRGGPIEAVLWETDGTIHILDRFEPSGTAAADAINAGGDVTGSTPVGGMSHCALWQAPAYRVEDCHSTPGGFGVSFGMDINDSGHVVVTRIVGNGPERCLLREADGTVRALDPPPGLQQNRCVAINNAGLIVGTSFSDPDEAGSPFPSTVTLYQDTEEPGPMPPVALASLVTDMGCWTELRRGLDVSDSGLILFEGICNGVVTSGLAIPTTVVAEEPPVETPVLEPRRPTHPVKARLMTLRERWDQFVTHLQVRQDKLERWQDVVQQWRARHGR